MKNKVYKAPSINVDFPRKPDSVSKLLFCGVCCTMGARFVGHKFALLQRGMCCGCVLLRLFAPCEVDYETKGDAVSYGLWVRWLVAWCLVTAVESTCFAYL